MVEVGLTMERGYGGGGSGGVGQYGYESGVVMSRDPRPRLRWTADLHDRFVDAVTKLGGPDSESLSLSPPPIQRSTRFI